MKLLDSPLLDHLASVLHMIFGKAYSLVPVYFNRELEFSHAPTVQFPFVVTATGGLTGMPLQIGPPWLGSVGAILWSLGVGVFLEILLWTIRSNLAGHDTVTGKNKFRSMADRSPG